MSSIFRKPGVLRRASIPTQGSFLRGAGALLAVGLTLLTASLCAQSRDARQARGPRALAVVEFPETGKPRLLPVTILIEGKYYDAEVYKATPAPMALEPGTVYEVGRSGESAGLFVVTRAVRVGKHWFAEGDWRPNPPPGTESKRNKAPSETPKTLGDEPPKLRRGPPPGATGTSSKPEATTQPPKPEASSSTSTPSTSPSGAADGDAPPVLSRAASAAKPESGDRAPAPANPAPAQAAPVAAEEPEDSSRPKLRRNAGPASSQGELSRESSVKERPLNSSARGNASPPAKAAAIIKVKELLPALSDAKPDQPRDYRFDWQPEERQRLESSAAAQALSAIKKYTETRAKGTPGSLEDVQVRAYNLDFSNTPYVVITATAAEKTTAPVSGTKTTKPGAKATAEANPPAAPGLRYFVTVVAREGLNPDGMTQTMRPVLVSVTDSTRLNVVPRLEFIDATDADGDQRAELLFRESWDEGTAYRLYRMIGDRGTELFSSGPGGD
ncbi:MAG TPA: hypothetical protein VG892_07980 [Terriglobales bacterium]|nr:hypothetical protein [Terriglobales bacterium]